MIDLTFRRYWPKLTSTAEDVRVVQEAADTTEHLLSSEANRVRLDAAMTEAHNTLETALERFRSIASETPLGERIGDPSRLEAELARTEALRKEARPPFTSHWYR